MFLVLIKLWSKKEREEILRMTKKSRLKKCNKVSKICRNLSMQLTIIELNGKRKTLMKFTKKNKRMRMKKLIRNLERKTKHSKNKRKNSKTRLQIKKKKNNN